MNAPSNLLAVSDPPARRMAGQALSRASGAPLIGGNSLQLLIDATNNYREWLKAVENAKSHILLENYIIRDDAIGHAFRDALVERAGNGIKVHVIFDWLGCLGYSRASFWKPLIDAGGQVRSYNPFRFGSPFGWTNRDHRKLLVVDRDIAFVGGLCISAKWLGDEKRNMAPWRDSAVGLSGPALIALEEAFSQVWKQLGSALLLPSLTEPTAAGDIDLRVIATEPDTAGMFRLDQMIAALAKRSLWIADAYFVGVSPYVEALCVAARDGVDVRLLVPGSSDLPVIRAISRSGYRRLLDAGVRVYEWKGAMMHAKTAVADDRWARVGSSNLNVASWIGNCELDIAVENEAFAIQMRDQYLRDLENTTEILLTERHRIPRHDKAIRSKHAGGSSGRAAASALRLAHSVGAALNNRQVLGHSEASVLPWVGASILGLSIVLLLWPKILTWPLGIVGIWIGLSALGRFIRMRRDAVAATRSARRSKTAKEKSARRVRQKKFNRVQPTASAAVAPRQS